MAERTRAYLSVRPGGNRSSVRTRFSTGVSASRTAILAFAAIATAGCANLHSIEDGRAYRSAQLSADGFRQVIAEQGIQTVIRLRGGSPGGKSGYDASFEPTREAGIDFVMIPMSAMSTPSKETLLELWETFETAKPPLLMHCRAGADRTGLASAIYVLQRTGDFQLASEQLHALPYFHLGWGGADAMDRVMEQYEPYQGVLQFDEWLKRFYEPEPR